MFVIQSKENTPIAQFLRDWIQNTRDNPVTPATREEALERLKEVPESEEMGAAYAMLSKTIAALPPGARVWPSGPVISTDEGHTLECTFHFEGTTLGDR